MRHNLHFISFFQPNVATDRFIFDTSETAGAALDPLTRLHIEALLATDGFIFVTAETAGAALDHLTRPL